MVVVLMHRSGLVYASCVALMRIVQHVYKRSPAVYSVVSSSGSSLSSRRKMNLNEPSA